MFLLFAQEKVLMNFITVKIATATCILATVDRSEISLNLFTMNERLSDEVVFYKCSFKEEPKTNTFNWPAASVFCLMLLSLSEVIF